jgi:hypothetical protein
MLLLLYECYDVFNKKNAWLGSATTRGDSFDVATYTALLSTLL